MTKSDLVTIFPLPDFYVPGVSHVEQEVSPERAAELLAYQPPAFTTDPPAEPAQPTGPADAGPSDSTEE